MSAQFVIALRCCVRLMCFDDTDAHYTHALRYRYTKMHEQQVTDLTEELVEAFKNPPATESGGDTADEEEPAEDEVGAIILRGNR